MSGRYATPYVGDSSRGLKPTANRKRSLRDVVVLAIRSESRSENGGSALANQSSYPLEKTMQMRIDKAIVHFFRVAVFGSLLVSSSSDVQAHEPPPRGFGGKAALVKSIIDSVASKETDAVLFIVATDYSAHGVAVMSDDRDVHIIARRYSFIGGGSGTFRNGKAWQTAQRCIEKLAADKDYSVASPKKRLTCIHLSRGQVKTFHLALDRLPECVRETLSMLPAGWIARRPVRQISIRFRRNVEKVTDKVTIQPTDLIRDVDSQKLAIINFNREIAIFNFTSDGLKSGQSLKSLVRSNLFSRTILHARMDKSGITIFWLVRKNDMSEVVVESVPFDGRKNSVRRPTLDGGAFAWASVDRDGNLFAVNNDGAAFLMPKDKQAFERVKRIPKSVRSCVASVRTDRAVVLDSAGNLDLWNTDTGVSVSRIKRSCERCSATFSPDGRFVAVEMWIRSADGGKTKRIVLLDCKTGDNLRHLRLYDVENSEDVRPVNWTSDSRFVYAGGFGGRSHPSRIHVWEVKTGDHIADLFVPKTALRAFEFDQTGDLLWGLTKNKYLVHWNLKKALPRADVRLDGEVRARPR
jgi:WD40 repeat protein